MKIQRKVSKKKRPRSSTDDAQWPRVYTRTHRSGQVGYVVDLGLVNESRQRKTFKTREEADTFAEQSRIKRQNEGLAGFALSHAVMVDAAKAHEILAPANVSLEAAAVYYRDHVLAFREAPSIDEIVVKLLADAVKNERRDRTIIELRSRLTTFADDFAGQRLSELTVQDIKEWIDEEDWSPRTRINYLTKISQLFNYAQKNGWVDFNLAERIDRPSVEDKEPGIFTVEQATRLLSHANMFGLLPFLAIGLFAGLRTAELLRLQADAVKLKDRCVVVGQSVAKKRSRRVVEMCDALVAWLNLCPKLEGPIVDESNFRERKAGLKIAAQVPEWPHNALRHSFGSYHLAAHGDATKTAHMMGHKDTDVVHHHYKALVLKSEAEKYWELRPTTKA